MFRFGVSFGYVSLQLQPFANILRLEERDSFRAEPVLLTNTPFVEHRFDRFLNFLDIGAQGDATS